MAAIFGVWSTNIGFLVHMLKKFLHHIMVLLSLHTPTFAMEAADESSELKLTRTHLSIQIDDPNYEPKVQSSYCLPVTLSAVLGLFVSGWPISYVPDLPWATGGKVILTVVIALVGAGGGALIGCGTQKVCEKCK